MIGLYCRKKEGNRQLCESCSTLWEYACLRLHHCPFGEKKTSCKKCRIHCYKPEKREQMRNIMRFSGPRMIFYRPGMALRHLFGK